MARENITLTNGASAKEVSDPMGEFLDKKIEEQAKTFTEGTDERLGTINKDKVFAISVAEAGAMGAPGQIIIAEWMGDQFDFITFYDAAKLEKIFPWVGEIRNWLLGQLENVDAGWHYRDMGFGNNLFVRNDVYELIEGKIISDEIGWLYLNWRRILCGYFWEEPEKADELYEAN